MLRISMSGVWISVGVQKEVGVSGLSRILQPARLQQAWLRVLEGRTRSLEQREQRCLVEDRVALRKGSQFG